MKIAILILGFLLQNAFAGIHSRNLWQKRDLSVCFAKGEEDTRRIDRMRFVVSDWSKRNKRRVQEWISEEYSRERTNISFYGFNDCVENDRSDVILFFHDNNLLEAYDKGAVQGITQSMGPLDYVAGFPEALNAVLISKSGMKKSIVVHEFGHVLGLAHEHNHHKARAYEGCDLINPNYHHVLVYHPYDPTSVMNYCYIFEKKNAGLSDQDAQLLRQIYQ